MEKVSTQPSTSIALPSEWNAQSFGNDWVYDDARLPQWWWDKVEVHGSHHIWQKEGGYYPYAVLARRLNRVAWHRVSAVPAMCGVERCVNPAHLSLVLKQEN